MTTPATQPKRPRGRPPGPPEAARTARVVVRLTPAQREKLARMGGAERVRRFIDSTRE